jgi:hypothetical protein
VTIRSAFAVIAVIVLGLAAAAVVAARATMASSAGGCTPPGVLRAGVYTTRCFLQGMRVTVPARGWRSYEDTPIELKLNPPNTTDPESPALRAWIDPHASTACTDKQLPVDISAPTKVVKWLKSNRNLIIDGPQRMTIARHIPALVVDVRVKGSAPRCDPSCPTACIDYFLFRAPQVAMHPYGTGPLEPARFYFAEIARPRHLFVFNVDATVGAAPTFAKMKSVAAKMLATMRLPSKLPPQRGR